MPTVQTHLSGLAHPRKTPLSHNGLVSCSQTNANAHTHDRIIIYASRLTILTFQQRQVGHETNILVHPGVLAIVDRTLQRLMQRQRIVLVQPVARAAGATAASTAAIATAHAGRADAIADATAAASATAAAAATS